ncbi:hypothetical protein F4780DRAFT_115344 [Xylariomycetidae sp. FL0641]|nr:hypothetical protein F4780DRAFT_115344 [Xylariomycetidae sp. FL0641]
MVEISANERFLEDIGKRGEMLASSVLQSCLGAALRVEKQNQKRRIGTAYGLPGTVVPREECFMWSSTTYARSLPETHRLEHARPKTDRHHITYGAVLLFIPSFAASQSVSQSVYRLPDQRISIGQAKASCGFTNGNADDHEIDGLLNAPSSLHEHAAKRTHQRTHQRTPQRHTVRSVWIRPNQPTNQPLPQTVGLLEISRSSESSAW